MENQWIETFKTGTHTDNQGQNRTVTAADLDRMVTNYNSAHHEAPLVIGHPKNNAPAYGWVEALKRIGKTLYFKARQVVPEFAEMVKSGLFKKRSVSIYPDGTLKHIGFLGAMPPAVKGLRDIADFSDEASNCLCFEENSDDRLYEDFLNAWNGLSDDYAEIEDDNYFNLTHKV